VVRRGAGCSCGSTKIAGLQAPRLNIVFLTHLHSDHTLGLPDLISLSVGAGRREPLRICYSPKGTQSMANHLIQALKEDTFGFEPASGGTPRDTKLSLQR
jgi:ribonuclease BN (tRNA processing enzyme)